eukprot:10083392-Alexandrium_andersonii.AAC.1
MVRTAAWPATGSQPPRGSMRGCPCSYELRNCTLETGERALRKATTCGGVSVARLLSDRTVLWRGVSLIPA